MDSRVKIPLSLQGHIIQDIQLGELIHYGTYSKVVEAKWEGMIVAVKQIHDIYEQDFEIAECDHIPQPGHANIVRFFGIYFPPGAKIPSVIMERLDCNLHDLLEQNPTIPIETKLSILHQTGLGLRYLHSRVPPIIYGKLSSKKVLISKGMEAKIAYTGTVFNTEHKSISIKQSHELDFDAPEINSPADRRCRKEVDVFSYGCIMLHTFSSTKPSHYVVRKYVKCLLTTLEEIKKNIQHLDKVAEDIIVPLIACCRKHLPAERPSMIEICDQLETLLIGRKHLPDNLLQAQLMLQEAKQSHIIPSSKQVNVITWLNL